VPMPASADQWNGAAVQESQPVIVVDGVSKRFRLYRDRASSLKEMITRRFRSRYDEFWAVRDVSLDIRPGQTFGLIGHNGSGKSTLLRLMAGIHPATKGTIKTTGRISALLELGAGFHPDLTGRENIYLNASILGLTRREVDEVIDQIISFAGLEEFIDTQVKVYSSGMYVRLGFAVAVHVKPDILFIDEVIAVGDEEFQRRCFDHLYHLRRQGVTIVLVSHSAGVMQTICDQVGWLDHGRMVELGDPNTVVKHYLEAVNRTEGERLDAEAQAASDDEDSTTSSIDAGSARGARRRLATGSDAAIEITGVDLLDGEGRSTRVGITGEPLVVRVSFAAVSPVEDPAFAVGIAHDSGLHVSGTNTVFHGIRTGTISGSGHIDFEIPRLSLLPGTYMIDVAITDRAMLHTFDHRLEEVVLHVQSGSTQQHSGLVDLGGSWRAPEIEDVGALSGRADAV
jgi:lipopolysaccharide transport system ATP-binding protein